MRPNAPTLAVLLAVVLLGVALAFAGSSTPTVEERWRALGVPEPRVEFIGDFTDAERAAWVRELKDAQAFYAERFGAVASDFTTYFGDDGDALNEVFRELHGEDRSILFDCGGMAPAKTLFIILEGCVDEVRRQGGPIAHEYFHIIQQDLLGRDLFADGSAIPSWIAEGSAVYASMLLAEMRYPGLLSALRESARSEWSAVGQPLPRSFDNDVDGMEEHAGALAYSVGFLAVEWLVERTGPRALMDYFRQGGGQSQFEAAFGMQWDEFHAAFEEHRAEVAPPYEWMIAGGVLGPGGEPLEGIQVLGVRRRPGEGPLPAGNAHTDERGEFTFRGPGRLFILAFVMVCPDGNRFSGPWAFIGEWGADGFAASEDGHSPPAVGAKPFAGAPQDRADLVVTLPETPEELAARFCPAP